MNTEKLTSKAAEAVSAAVTRAAVDQAASVEPVHLLLAVLALEGLVASRPRGPGQALPAKGLMMESGTVGEQL